MLLPFLVLAHAVPTEAALLGGSAPLCRPLLLPRAPVARHQMMAGEPAPSVGKAALVDAIALKAGVSKKTAALVLGATLDVIVDSVCDNHKVSLVGFGTFSAKERPEREARNPKTGEKMIVKAATVPSFSFGKSFKDAVKARGTGGSAAQGQGDRPGSL